MAIDFTPKDSSPPQGKIDFTPKAAAPKIDFTPKAAAPSKAGTWMGDTADILKKRLWDKPIGEAGQQVKEQFHEGADMAMHPKPVDTTLPPSLKGSGWDEPRFPGVDTLLTQAKRPIGAVQAATAPLFALSHGYISKPVEELTGGKIKADWVDLVRMWTPAGYAGAAGLAERAAKALTPEKNEKIVAAAVKYGDNVLTGKNHAEAYQMAGKVKGTDKLDEGFKTNKRGFITREEAAGLGKKTGQAPNTEIEPGKLHSEDVAKAAGLAPEEGIPQKKPSILQNAAKGIESIFSPTSMSKEAKITEGVIREARGTAELRTAQAQYQVDTIAHTVNNLPPEQKAAFVHYIETSSQEGAKLPKVEAAAQSKFHKAMFGETPGLQQAADTVKGIYSKVRNVLENTAKTEKMGFVQDYFVHYWKDPKKAQAFAADWVSKAGSGRSTMARTIPTIQDGIKAGLEPLYDNPLDSVMRYAADMHNYLGLNQIQEQLSSRKLRVFKPEGFQPPGWVQLKGPGNRILYAAEDTKGTGKVAGLNYAYAPEDVARIYNRFYGKGFEGIPYVRDLYKATRTILNAPLQMLLGFSGYHYRLVGGEAIASSFGEALGRAVRGDAPGAAKSLVKTLPVAGPLYQGLKGRAIEHMGLTGEGNLNPRVIDFMVRGGARLTGIDASLKNTVADNWIDAWKKGTARTQLKAGATSVGGFFKAVGATMDTISYPLMKKTIPRMKNAAIYDGLADWMLAHPDASEDQILEASRDVIDSTDNAMGEMVMDNMFQHKMLKQTAQIMLLSIGWDIGTLRQYGGGMNDLRKYVAGDGELTPRAKYIIGAPIAHMQQAMVYQYLKTGKGPQVPQDLVYPQTGGEVEISPDTKYSHQMPERANIPSQMKDVIGYQEDPVKELGNKMQPVWKVIGQMVNNGDFRNDPIAYHYMDNAPTPLKAYLTYAFGNLGLPISEKSVEGEKIGTNIGASERLFLGAMPTGMPGSDPEAYREMLKKLETEREEKGMRHKQTEEDLRLKTP